MDANVNETVETEVKVAVLSHKDVQLAFLGDGLDGVRNLYKTGAVSAAVIARAAREVANNKGTTPEALEALVSFAEEITPVKTGNGRRGKQPPSVGQTRTYKAQSVKGSTPFIRLNLDTLNVLKGAEMKVTFQDANTIVVTK